VAVDPGDGRAAARRTLVGFRYEQSRQHPRQRPDHEPDEPLDPLSDFSIPGDTDLHTDGDASGADGEKIAEPGTED
jgi:hypothetical protein